MYSGLYFTFALCAPERCASWLSACLHFTCCPCTCLRPVPRCVMRRCAVRHRGVHAPAVRMRNTSTGPPGLRTWWGLISTPRPALDSIYLIYECVYDSNAHSSLLYLYRSSTTTHPAHYKGANCNYTARSSLNCPPLRTWAPFLALDAAHRDRTPSRRAVAPQLRTLGSYLMDIASLVYLRLPPMSCWKIQQ